MPTADQQQLMDMVNHLIGLQGQVSQMQQYLLSSPNLITHGPPPTDAPASPPPTPHTPSIRPRLWRNEEAYNRGVQS
eukprot:2508400-Karenia_brevis.AAC.1